MEDQAWHHSQVRTRRGLLGWGCGLLGAATFVQLPYASIGRAETGKIRQPATPTPDAFARRAFAMRDLAVAQGDRGYGAIIVHVASGKIVAEAPSRVVTNTDPSAHAEMEAIRDAARTLGSRDLSSYAMYASSPPCAMCEAAAYWANLSAYYYGRSATAGGAPKLCR